MAAGFWVGRVKSDVSMQQVTTWQQYHKGRYEFKHVRCGRVVIERPTGKGLGADWVVIEVEKPDPKEE